MPHLFILCLALFAAQAPTPATPPPSEPPAAQPAQPTPTTTTPDQAAPSATTPDQAAPAKPPCRNPDESGNYHVGCGVTAPKITYKQEPNFSEEAKKQKIGGFTLLSLTVDAEGHPVNIHVVRSSADRVDKVHRAVALTLDQAAIDAVKKYRFTPATYQGKPVPVVLYVEIDFNIY
jgi:TonB family protein